ncbi:MAG: PhoH family protein, partial [Ilumatobacteraceae bacterium]
MSPHDGAPRHGRNAASPAPAPTNQRRRRKPTDGANGAASAARPAAARPAAAPAATAATLDLPVSTPTGP